MMMKRKLGILLVNSLDSKMTSRLSLLTASTMTKSPLGTAMTSSTALIWKISSISIASNLMKPTKLLLEIATTAPTLKASIQTRLQSEIATIVLTLTTASTSIVTRWTLAVMNMILTTALILIVKVTSEAMILTALISIPVKMTLHRLNIRAMTSILTRNYRKLNETWRILMKHFRKVTLMMKMNHLTESLKRVIHGTRKT